MPSLYISIVGVTTVVVAGIFETDVFIGSSPCIDQLFPDGMLFPENNVCNDVSVAFGLSCKKNLIQSLIFFFNSVVFVCKTFAKIKTVFS